MTTKRTDRITPAELTALVRVMREGGVIDMASGDTRIILSPVAIAPVPMGSDKPLQPIERQKPNAALDDEDEDDALYDAVP